MNYNSFSRIIHQVKGQVLCSFIIMKTNFKSLSMEVILKDQQKKGSTVINLNFDW